MRSYLGMTNWPIEEPGAILNRKYIDKTVPRSLSFYITKTKNISDAFQKSLFMLLTKYTQSSFTKLYKKNIHEQKTTPRIIDQTVPCNFMFTFFTFFSSLFQMDFMANKPSSGFYKMTISVAPQKANAQLLGTSGASVTVKVTTQVGLENIELGVADKDQVAAPKPIR